MCGGEGVGGEEILRRRIGRDLIFRYIYCVYLNVMVCVMVIVCCDCMYFLCVVDVIVGVFCVS